MLDEKAKMRWRYKFYRNGLRNPSQPFVTSKDGNLRLRNVAKSAKKPNQKKSATSERTTPYPRGSSKARKKKNDIDKDDLDIHLNASSESDDPTPQTQTKSHTKTQSKVRKGHGSRSQSRGRFGSPSSTDHSKQAHGHQNISSGSDNPSPQTQTKRNNKIQSNDRKGHGSSSRSQSRGRFGHTSNTDHPKQAQATRTKSKDRKGHGIRSQSSGRFDFTSRQAEQVDLDEHSETEFHNQYVTPELPKPKRTTRLGRAIITPRRYKETPTPKSKKQQKSRARKPSKSSRKFNDSFSDSGSNSKEPMKESDSETENDPIKQSTFAPTSRSTTPKDKVIHLSSNESDSSMETFVKDMRRREAERQKQKEWEELHETLAAPIPQPEVKKPEEYSPTKTFDVDMWDVEFELKKAISKEKQLDIRIQKQKDEYVSRQMDSVYNQIQNECQFQDEQMMNDLKDGDQNDASSEGSNDRFMDDLLSEEEFIDRRQKLKRRYNVDSD